jgi:hypothetical protein
MTNLTPRRFTARVAGVPRRLGRLMEGAVDTNRTYDDTMDVAPNGRLGVRVAKGSILRQTKRGLDIDPQAVGEKNRPQLAHITDIAAGSTLAETITTFNALLAELRRTKNMRGGF